MNKLLLLLTAGLLGLFGTSVWREVDTEWRAAQLGFAEEAARREPKAKAMGPGLRQVWNAELGVIDRCTNCHLGTERPAMKDAREPFRAHPGNLLASHPPDKFGCTVCHEGQGLATTARAAHGPVEHWERPLLPKEFVHASCGKCHYENELFGAGTMQADLYGKEKVDRAIYEAELAASLPGSPLIQRGKQRMIESGCLGCHKYRGKGGLLGPDITYVGDKTAHDFDFAHVKGPHEVRRWLFEHFKFPREISPGTMMPELHLTDPQAWELTAFMLSFHKKAVPAKYTPLPRMDFREPAGGKALFSLFCAACHGGQGEGSAVAGISTPSLNNPDTLAIASDDYLRHIITHGRPGTRMIAWRRESGGLLAPEIDRLVARLRAWEPQAPEIAAIDPASGDRRAGGILFRARCGGCHGRNGEGGIGNALNNPSFLAAASDEFLRDTILNGRANTAMPSWKDLSAQQVSDLIAFLRSWYPIRYSQAEVLAQKPNLKIGKKLFAGRCAPCHGRDGAGEIGPSLNSPSFLAVASREYLFQAIVNGRPGTAMPAWRQLAKEDVADLIGFIKSWQKVPDKPAADRVVRGDWERGKILYGESCADCHGKEGEGLVGPQLHNPVFLRSVSDGYLYETIAYGREDSVMSAFLRGRQGLAEYSERQIEDLVAYVRRWESQPRRVIARYIGGSAGEGAKTYAKICAQCHGERGEGKTGPALANPDFLRLASDGFLLAIMVMGRDGTEMKPVVKGAQGNFQLTADELTDVVAFLRAWETRPPPGIPHRRIQGDPAHGRALFTSFCASCHGREGKGGMAPELNNQGFLAAATDGFLQATIVRGRYGTAMRPFGRGGHGVAELDTTEINDLVSFIRSWMK